MHLSSRRLWLAISLASLGLTVASVVMTHWLKLHPCHLCIFQRLLFMLLGISALVAAGSLRWRLPAGLLSVGLCLGGIATALHQMWLQAHADPWSCGGPLAPDLIQQLIAWLTTLSPLLFRADGLCTDKQLEIFGIALAGWSLIGFSVFLLAGIWALLKARR
jgi:disulfide bond formation protein DsbB